MDWNSVTSRAKQVKAPGIDVMSRTRVHTMDGLIELLKDADAAEARRVRRGMLAFAAVGVLLAFAFIVSFIGALDNGEPGPSPHTGLLALLYGGIAFMAWRAWRRLTRVDYAAPVRAFLEDAEKRYRLVSPRDVLMSLPLVLLLLLSIYTGGTYVAGVMTRYFGSGSEDIGLVIYGAIIAAAFLVGIVATRADWRKKKAPLWRDIRAMIAELSREESANGEKS